MKKIPIKPEHMYAVLEFTKDLTEIHFPAIENATTRTEFEDAKKAKDAREKKFYEYIRSKYKMRGRSWGLMQNKDSGAFYLELSESKSEHTRLKGFYKRSMEKIFDGELNRPLVDLPDWLSNFSQPKV